MSTAPLIRALHPYRKPIELGMIIWDMAAALSMPMELRGYDLRHTRAVPRFTVWFRWHRAGRIGPEPPVPNPIKTYRKKQAEAAIWREQ
jgi:hypothetical protein